MESRGLAALAGKGSMRGKYGKMVSEILVFRAFYSVDFVIALCVYDRLEWGGKGTFAAFTGGGGMGSAGACGADERGL